MLWHEHMSRRNIDNSEALQVRPASTPPSAFLQPCNTACLLLTVVSRTTDTLHAMVANATAADAGASSEAFLDLPTSQRKSAPKEFLKDTKFTECVAAQERRVVEYVSLGDFQTAVGFLLASTPEKSIRYYRDALCTLALAVSMQLMLLS